MNSFVVCVAIIAMASVAISLGRPLEIRNKKGDVQLSRVNQFRINTRKSVHPFGWWMKKGCRVAGQLVRKLATKEQNGDSTPRTPNT